eukprot:CAMPEP_0183733926 /NCGR_PEP_ID=MMETSP0737-20130205/42457_1 /TAXON_ID=385413 /ORGANISM="Thalassiosira miniscula, Strain CCMP1093" /LENGTH=384 /DNA_ID=CAMNT_0025967299 /DNA_START=237 /DNA_END=1391 /DNA_ORIENTATION=+
MNLHKSHRNEAVRFIDKNDKQTMVEMSIRRLSDLTTDDGEFDDSIAGFGDIRREYQNAIKSMCSCESVIETLRKQLSDKDEIIASKDVELASKDEIVLTKDDRIASLEKKIIEMSLELASTKASHEELQLRHKTQSDALSDSLMTMARYRPKSVASSSRRRRESDPTPSRIGTSSSTQPPPEHAEDANTAQHVRKPSLIVDFAHRRKSYAPQKRSSSIGNDEKLLSVHFSPSQDWRFYERPDEDACKKLFYATKDYDEMREARRRDVKDVHMRYDLLCGSAATTRSSRAVATSASNDASMASDPELFGSASLLGIEDLLDADVTDKLLRRREECIAAVLDEQARQRDSGGEADPNRIAHLSQIRSAWSVRRAVKIASYLYSNGP